MPDLPWWAWLLVIPGVFLALLGVLGWLVWHDPRVRLIVWALRRVGVRRSFRGAWGLIRDPRLPLLVRLLPLAILTYWFWPVDLILDLIPLIGQADDALLAISGLWLLVRLTPWRILSDHFDVDPRARGPDGPYDPTVQDGVDVDGPEPDGPR